MATMDRERVSFVQLTPAIRRRLEATVENLIAMLDAIDGDPDDEPGLGAPELRAELSQAHWPRGALDDGETTGCEADDAYGSNSQDRHAQRARFGDDDEDGGDLEHSRQRAA